ncbi:MAG TPA: hypothetical protein VF074_22195 [Pyrinomonadaceae bacterium]
MQGRTLRRVTIGTVIGSESDFFVAAVLHTSQSGMNQTFPFSAKTGRQASPFFLSETALLVELTARSLVKFFSGVLLRFILFGHFWWEPFALIVAVVASADSLSTN